MNFEVAHLISNTFISLYMRLVARRTQTLIPTTDDQFFLPDKIIGEILSRLDLASLMRYKCVCKSWRYLISHDPFFRKMHLKYDVPYILLGGRVHVSRRPYAREIMLSYSGLDQISKFRLPQVESGASLVVEGSDNGIVCLSEYKNNTTIYLWNPTTKEVKKLPFPTGHSWQSSVFRIGIGYDQVTNDFKVVRVSGSLSIGDNLFERDNKVSVYSLRSNSWKIIEMTNMFSLSSHVSQVYKWSVVVNGYVHWSLAYFENVHDLEFGISKFAIVAFDLNTEVFKLIKSVPQQHVKGTVGKLSECLAFMTSGTIDLIEIWVMKEYGVSDSWIKQMTVDLTTCSIKWSSRSWPLIKEDPDFLNLLPVGITMWLFKRRPWRKLLKFTPLAFGNNGHVLLNGAGFLFCYDPNNNSLGFVCTEIDVGFTNYVKRAHPLK